MKIAVLLSGCGVYDGAEIHESVLTLLALDKLGAEVVCTAPDAPQHHVINHMNGEELPETRNILLEAARIARGSIVPLHELQVADIDALVIPGGFGAAKNLTQWAFSGPDGDILPDVQRIIVEIVEAKKPLAAFCMGPTVVAKALQGTDKQPQLTVGSTEAASPYDIAGISSGVEATGATAVMRLVDEIVVDETYSIVSSPCYMMEASIAQIQVGIEKACEKLVEMIKAGS